MKRQKQFRSLFIFALAITFSCLHKEEFIECGITAENLKIHKTIEKQTLDSLGYRIDLLNSDNGIDRFSRLSTVEFSGSELKIIIELDLDKDGKLLGCYANVLCEDERLSSFEIEQLIQNWGKQNLSEGALVQKGISSLDNIYYSYDWTKRTK